MNIETKPRTLSVEDVPGAKQAIEELTAKLGHTPATEESYDNLVKPADAVLHNSNITVNNEGDLVKDGWAYREEGLSAIVAEVLAAAEQTYVPPSKEPDQNEPEVPKPSLVAVPSPTLKATITDIFNNEQLLQNNKKSIIDIVNDGVADHVTRAKLIRALNRRYNDAKTIIKLLAGLHFS